MENITRMYAVESDGYLSHVKTIHGACDYDILEKAALDFITSQGEPIRFLYTIETYLNLTRQDGIIYPFTLK